MIPMTSRSETIHLHPKKAHMMKPGTKFRNVILMLQEMFLMRILITLHTVMMIMEISLKQNILEKTMFLWKREQPQEKMFIVLWWKETRED